MDDAQWMAVALEEAAAAGRAGDVPVGAVVVAADGTTELARARNEREQRGDPTAHAELLALQAAATALGNGWRLPETTLIVTLEPCVMCAGALVAARVRRVVFGAYDLKGGACGSLYNVCVDPRLNWEVEVAGGVLADDCLSVLTEFFADRRR